MLLPLKFVMLFWVNLIYGNIMLYIDADPPSLLRATQPPGLGSIKKLSLIDSPGLC
jgi:hypothetical protein